MKEIKQKVNSILLDTDLNFVGLKFYMTVTEFLERKETGNRFMVTAEQLKERFKNNNESELRFLNLSVKYKEEAGKQYVVLNTLDCEYMHTDLAYSLEDTLHKRYGKNNLKLKKVAYIDDGETFGDKHVVDYILFDILKEGNVVGELKLTSKQLYINLIMGSNPGGTFREIDPNYNSLNCLSSFDVYSGPCRYSMPWFLYSGKDRREEDNYKVVESKGRQDKIKAWMNKMDITFGGCIKTRDGILEKCNITTIESISIPDFVYVNKDAFSESSIKEVRITSPETIILPFNDIRKTLLTDDMIKYSKKLRYKNKFKEDIKFVEAYDAESGENPYELNSLQKTYFMNKLITFDMKFGTNRFMTQRIVDQEFEI